MLKSKKDFEEYQTLMNHQFDIEDRIAKIYNEKWKLSNENTKLGLQLRIVQDQLRSMFNRFRIELKSDKDESNNQKSKG